MFYNDSIFRILFLEKIEFGDFEQFSSNFNSKKIANFLQKTSYFLCYLVGVIYKGRTRNWDAINQMKKFKCHETEDENLKDVLVVAELVFGGGVLAMWVVLCRCFGSGAEWAEVVLDMTKGAFGGVFWFGGFWWCSCFCLTGQVLYKVCFFFFLHEINAI